MVCTKQYFSLNVGLQEQTEGNCKKINKTTHQMHHIVLLQVWNNLLDTDKRCLQKQEAEQTNVTLEGHIYSLFFFLLRPPSLLLQIIL